MAACYAERPAVAIWALLPAPLERAGNVIPLSAAGSMSRHHGVAVTSGCRGVAVRRDLIAGVCLISPRFGIADFREVVGEFWRPVLVFFIGV
jgi:hypothetical protein